MSFYTALTGLKGAQTDISTTSNNIANVGSNGFKKSRAEFGDIYGSTPLQAKTVGGGTLTKSITQQFSQGNISTSSNSLDMAISGQGFFALQSGGIAAQTVYTRNGAFNVDDSGFIVDSNGQFLLGYPVDNAGVVSDKTLAGANKLKLDSSYGDPAATTSVSMGVNLPAGEPVIASNVIFDATDPDTYSATAAVTIFDNAGNPKSATVYYIKTQNPTTETPTHKYDTKLFVDGAAITPTLTRAVDPQAFATNPVFDAEGFPTGSLFIDKFGNKTTTPQDPAYILAGKGYRLYKEDQLGAPVDSTPATLKGVAVPDFLGMDKTVTIVTDPLKFKATMEYQALQGVTSPVPGTFWGKDFLLVNIDNSGPVSIDIPPGTYDGTQLAQAVEIAVREAFGDNKKVQLTPAVDNTFSIDLKKTAGDGLSSGLSTGPITVDLQGASLVATAAEAVAGLEMDTFLSHAQVKMTEAMNTYVQGVSPADPDGVNAANVASLGVDGRLFKKLVGGSSVPVAAIPTGNDIITITHKEGHTGATLTSTDRYIAYSNPTTGAKNNRPEVKAYDLQATMDKSNVNRYGVSAAGVPFISVPKANFSLTPETVRFMQFPTGGSPNTALTTFFGTEDIAVSNVIEDPNQAANYRVSLTFDMGTATAFPVLAAAEAPIFVLAKPSDNIAAYFEGTEGLVEGVDDAFYTGKIVFQEIGTSAKRLAAQSTTINAAAGDTALAVKGATLASTANISTLGLASAVQSTNWVDERNPSVKIGYDEAQQRLTFDATNSELGLGTGIGKNSFTIYSPSLASGTAPNRLGIPAFGNNLDISLASDDKSLGNAFLNKGPEIQVANKRFGATVEFDTVNYAFSIKSGTTGEALAANQALGISENQSASSIAIGRYKLTNLGGPDPVDEATAVLHKIGDGNNQILGFPRAGIDGFTGPTGIVSQPAVATGIKGLVDMSKAFSITEVAGENSFTVVVDGVSAFLKIPSGNYSGTTLALALQDRINAMEHPSTGTPIDGVKVAYNMVTNNLTFKTGSTGGGSTIKIEGAQRFGLKDIPLGIGETAKIRTPVQATNDAGEELYVSPTGVITADTAGFVNNLVEDFYPLFLDDGELTFNKAGELTSPFTKVTYDGLPNVALTVDFSKSTQYAQPFAAVEVSQDGYAAGRLTNLEIDNYGSVKAGYSNGTNVTLGKIIIANFNNNSGLKQIGNSTFMSTASSGDPELGEAAEDGFGNILSGSLERSNVDITEELVNLITAQRNYQAAAKAMETTTSMTQTIINIRL